MSPSPWREQRRDKPVETVPLYGRQRPPKASQVEASMALFWRTRECFICTEAKGGKVFGPCEHREFEIADAWAERMRRK